MNRATRGTEGNATAPVLYMGLESSDLEACVRRRRHAPAGDGACGRSGEARRGSGEGEGEGALREPASARVASCYGS